MKTIIAGGRSYKFCKADVDYLNTLDITEVVSGGAQGADKQGELYARYREIPIKQFPANWDKFGKAAGPIRNEEMAKYADRAVIFPGGRGSASIKQLAEKYGLHTTVINNIEANTDE